MRPNRHIELVVLFTVLCIGTTMAQADYPWLRTGDELYKRHSFTDAETAYRKAQEEKDKPTTSFNLGNSIYHQNRLPEAIQHYQESIASTEDPELKAKAWYNLGNVQYESQDFEKSMQAYKESLKLQPEDEDAKKNLMLAMRQYQQQQQQKQQQQQQDNKDQNNKDQQQQQQQNQDQQNKDQQEQNASKDQSQGDQQSSADEVSRDEAKEILKAIEREDQRVQEKLKKASGKTAPPVKDW